MDADTNRTYTNYFPLLDAPEDILLVIQSNLEIAELLMLSLTCTALREQVQGKSLSLEDNLYNPFPRRYSISITALESSRSPMLCRDKLFCSALANSGCVEPTPLDCYRWAVRMCNLPMLEWLYNISLVP